MSEAVLTDLPAHPIAAALQAAATLNAGQAVRLPPGPFGLLLGEALSHWSAPTTALLAKDDTPPLHVVLWSGGLDSTVALIRAVRAHGAPNVHALRLTTPAEYDARERIACAQLRHSVPELAAVRFVEQGAPLFNAAGTHIIPARNLLYVLQAHAYAAGHRRASVIHLSSVAGESAYHGHDKSHTFKHLLDEHLRAQVYPGALALPTTHETKGELLRWWRAAGLPMEAANDTLSCQSSLVSPCGRCQACFARWAGELAAGVVNFYNHPPQRSAGNSHVKSRLAQAHAILRAGYATPADELTYAAAAELAAAEDAAHLYHHPEQPEVNP